MTSTPHFISATLLSALCLSLLVAALLSGSVSLQAQQKAQTHSFCGTVTDAVTKEEMKGVTIKLLGAKKNLLAGAISDTAGKFCLRVPANLLTESFTLRATYSEYKQFERTISLNVGNDSLNEINLAIVMEQMEAEADEVVISASRIARAIDDIPIRVEVIPAADLDESITVGIASAKMVLGELPGIMAQTNSASIGAATVRIRGLDGRYTQILQDGIPAFGGLNMNFSVLTLPPLNLRQLEIIKGSAAGLHSADAIGGIINYITKSPEKETPELTAVAAYNSLGGFDASAFYGQKFDNLGFSLHSTYNTQVRRDLDGDGFADVPAQQRFSVNPKLTYDFSPKTKLTLSGAFSSDRRLGGEMSAPENYEQGSDTVFAAAQRLQRVNVTGTFVTEASSIATFVVNAAYTNTNRASYQQTTIFNGAETIGYADAQMSVKIGKFQGLLGLSAMNQAFTETGNDVLTGENRSFNFSTLSAFWQGEYAFSEMFSFLLSWRFDYNTRYGFLSSPRPSFMFRPDKNFIIRLSGGQGWRAPTIFDETAEERLFLGVPALQLTKPERSEGLTLDAQYKFIIGEAVINANLNGFFTHIGNRAGLTALNPLAPTRQRVYTWSSGGDLISQGAELIFDAKIDELSLFFGYTFADVREGTLNTSVNDLARKTLTPLHFINAAALWEIPNVVRVVSDFMLQSPQLLPTNEYLRESPTVVTWGGSVEVWMPWEEVHGLSVFLNVENLLDFRQTRYMPLYLGGSPRSSTFSGGVVWGPVDGRVVSLGVKYKL